MTIIHVGMPKTGTTALQQFLGAHDVLANGNKDGKWPGWGARVAGFQMSFAEHVRTESVIAVPRETSIVSDEDLVLCELPEAVALEAAVESEWTVLVIRDFSELCESWWREQVKHGETRTLNEWVNQVALRDPEKNPEARRVRYDYVHNVWRPCDVLFYERDFVQQFVNAFVPQLKDSVANVPRSNTSLSIEATEALRKWLRWHDCRYEVLQKIVAYLLTIDVPSDWGMSVATKEKFLRYDNEMQFAMMHEGIAYLDSLHVELRELDNTRIEFLYDQIVRATCTEFGNTTDSAQVTS